MSTSHNGTSFVLPNSVDAAFTIMLLGDSCTGKTCLLVRFKDNTFLNNNFISTVGIDYRNKILDIDDCKVRLQIWDTAGQERFRSVTHAYYRDADALLLVFDVTNRRSFENVRTWVLEVRDYARKDVALMIVGNKADLADQRKVKLEEAQKLSKDYGVTYIETSARTGYNVETAFLGLARELVSKKLHKEDNGVKLGVADFAERPRSSCCGKP